MNKHRTEQNRTEQHSTVRHRPNTEQKYNNTVTITISCTIPFVGRLSYSGNSLFRLSPPSFSTTRSLSRYYGITFPDGVIRYSYALLVVLYNTIDIGYVLCALGGDNHLSYYLSPLLRIFPLVVPSLVPCFLIGKLSI